jgi:Acetyltransferases, including N-acetylases of ribosomal proteins
MEEIQTDRLRLVALDLENLYHYIHDYERVQTNLGVSVTMPIQDQEIKYVFSSAHYEASAHPEDILWYTSWEVILKDENVIIGGISFKGPPDDQLEVEIGYEIVSEYQQNGYATEATAALIKWAKEVKHIERIIACVEPHNYSSTQVLRKLGFNYFESDEGLNWWRKI